MSEWKKCKLSDVVASANTGLDAIRRAPIVEKETGLKCLRIQDISQNKPFIKWGNTEVKPENYQRYQLRQNDIIMARTCSTGICTFIKNDMNAVFNNGLVRIRANIDRSFPSFLYYLFLSRDFIGHIDGISGGTSVQLNMQVGDLLSYDLMLPPLPEQRSIGGLLSSLDDKIDLLHRQNKTLEGMAEALWRKMFVEEADPGWKNGKLGDLITSIETGRRPKGGIDPNLTVGVPSIGAESINGLGNYDFNKTKYITEEYYSQMNSGKIQNYDILIYKDGAYIGKKSMFANGFPFDKCCINEHVFILRTGKVNSQLFLYFVLEQEELEQLNANSAQPGLNQEALKSFEILYPNKDLIDDFGIKVKPLIDKIFMNSVQIRSLSRLRDTLLPKLMSGEMRVKL